jgi:uncharacterized membrane protein YsdA (DUF1294 family)
VCFSFGKLKEIGSLDNLRNYVIDTTAENHSDKRISEATFFLYLVDKNKVERDQAR